MIKNYKEVKKRLINLNYKVKSKNCKLKTLHKSINSSKKKMNF